MYEIELENLRNSPRRKFTDWDNEKNLVPEKSGVYVIWMSGRFLYAGLAKDNEKGLHRRLNKHAMGQRGGNQFCVRVCDAFIVPFLGQELIDQLKKGINIFDGKKGLIRKFVRENLDYQFLETGNTLTARQLEETLRTGESSLGSPFLNPKKPKVIIL
jgi:hypothetical protein